MTGDRRRLAREALSRLGLGGGLGLLLAWLGETFGHAPGLESLRLTGAGAFAAGLFFGWAGPLGYLLAHALFHAIVGPAPSLGQLARVAVTDLALGWAAYATFRGFSLHRGLSSLRDCLGLLAAAALGGGAAALVAASRSQVAGFWVAAGTWWAAYLTSIVLLVPLAVVLLGDRALPRPAPRPAVERDPLAGPVSGTAGSGPWLDWIAALGLVVAISVLVRTLGSGAAALDRWLVLLYLLPLLWAAHRRGLRGGIVTGCAVGLAYLTARSIDLESQGSPASWHSRIVGQQAAAVGLMTIGVLLGSSRDVERRLRRDLQAANQRLRIELRSVVDALRSALGAKDAYTEGHVGRVASYAVATGRRLGMTEHQLELLEVASLLHDVGKIGIPEKILHKDGALDPDERAIMQQHPEIGARILDDLEGLRAAAPLVRHHQERYDGKTDCEFPGYPQGLAGDGIPLGARVIAVVDAFDAMTSDRSYRAARTVPEAIAELRRERGRQFDPAVVDVFLRVIEERPWLE